MERTLFRRALGLLLTTVIHHSYFPVMPPLPHFCVGSHDYHFLSISAITYNIPFCQESPSKFVLCPVTLFFSVRELLNYFYNVPLFTEIF